jgi:hypothetical protein
VLTPGSGAAVRTGGRKCRAQGSEVQQTNAYSSSRIDAVNLTE